LEISVTVSYTAGSDQPLASSSLRRYVRNPQVLIDAAAAQQAEAQQAGQTSRGTP
jgi:hypothetical protein